MLCQHAHENLSDYVSGETDRALTVTLENHLNDCADCREAVADLRRIWSALDTLPVEEPPAALHGNIMSALRQTELEQTAAPARRSALASFFQPRNLAVAAALLLVLLLVAPRAVVADFDPLSAIVRMVRPAPAALSGPAKTLAVQSHAEWAPAASGGSLTVRLKLQPGATKSAAYELSLAGQSLGRGTVTADHETVVVVPLAATPGAEGLSVSLTDPDGAAAPQTVSTPISGAAAP